MRKILFVFFILSISLSAYSWGERGHKIVALIAKKCLEKRIIDSVQFYLGRMSFKEASVWMDVVRQDNTYNYMKPWHYINIERQAVYVKSEEENVVNELEKVISALKNKKALSKSEIALNLRILFHLVGDLHQPLHAGYGEDKGGNEIDVDFLGEPSNLHKVWDTEIIEKKKIRLKDCFVMANAMTVEEKKSCQKIDVVLWMNESRELLPGVYSFEKRIISRDYIEKNETIIEKQLVKAGIRLATVLYQTFNK
jgi:hypothetical protein